MCKSLFENLMRLCSAFVQMVLRAVFILLERAEEEI